MEKNWIDEIVYEDGHEVKQRNKLIEWCGYIGYKKYFNIYNLIYELNGKSPVKYKELETLAKYDFKLADIIFSVIKFIELHLRALILDNFDDFELTKENYLYEISKKFNGNKKLLPCDTKYRKNSNCNLTSFTDDANLATIIRLVLCLPDSILKDIEIEGRNLSDDLELIRNVRNDISHGHILINKDRKLTDICFAILSYIPSDSIKNRFKKELEDVSKFLKENIKESLLIQNEYINIDELFAKI